MCGFQFKSAFAYLGFAYQLNRKLLSNLYNTHTCHFLPDRPHTSHGHIHILQHTGRLTAASRVLKIMWGYLLSTSLRGDLSVCKSHMFQRFKGADQTEGASKMWVCEHTALFVVNKRVQGLKWPSERGKYNFAWMMVKAQTACLWIHKLGNKKRYNKKQQSKIQAKQNYKWSFLLQVDFFFRLEAVWLLLQQHEVSSRVQSAYCP